MLAAPLLLAGLLPVEPQTADCWRLSGAWFYPVGDRMDFTRGTTLEDSGYRVNRGVGLRAGSHQGADLSNRRPGGPVRAAADGLVVLAQASQEGGYGCHVVLAHRLVDGDIVYSVYAHLAPGSLAVRPGLQVSAGDLLGRVGRTGRATSPHLHFEVRRPVGLEQRWEKAPVADPIAFVAARLPRQRSDSTSVRPYLLWAEAQGLLEPDQDPHRALERHAWWRILVAATCGDDDGLATAEPESLRVRLEREGILKEQSGDRVLGWREVTGDLSRARGRGLRIGPSPTAAAERNEACRLALGLDSPGRRLEELSCRREPPTSAEVCLVLADLAGDPPHRPRRALADSPR